MLEDLSRFSPYSDNEFFCFPPANCVSLHRLRLLDSARSLNFSFTLISRAFFLDGPRYHNFNHAVDTMHSATCQHFLHPLLRALSLLCLSRVWISPGQLQQALTLLWRSMKYEHIASGKAILCLRYSHFFCIGTTNECAIERMSQFLIMPSTWGFNSLPAAGRCLSIEIPLSRCMWSSKNADRFSLRLKRISAASRAKFPSRRFDVSIVSSVRISRVTLVVQC